MCLIYSSKKKPLKNEWLLYSNTCDDARGGAHNNDGGSYHGDKQAGA
ncbi:hypothetical protein BDD43_1014 [Mucilaginibacter gracilis]|uniref:Uncharacterized protein n=1 Tax=Mucilaginibacter gracilis TaxID=423350 RepID=A0A495IVU6_9SPHI|nr:hypothetical protein BDD43_1014 [Mucilaginibacter gracilis]